MDLVNVGLHIYVLSTRIAQQFARYVELLCANVVLVVWELTLALVFAGSCLTDIGTHPQFAATVATCFLFRTEPVVLDESCHCLLSGPVILQLVSDLLVSD